MTHPSPTRGEEIANSITHGAGAVLSVAGLVVAVLIASMRGTATLVVAVAVYGATLVLLYLSSTLYHAIPNRRAKKLFQVFDHSAIFLLIAGTYTPFSLVTLRGPWGWSLLGTVWGLAVTGIVFKCFFVDRLMVLSTAVYVGMGWLAVVAIKPLSEALPWGGLLGLLAGGLFYTGGVAFFAWNRRYSHSVWHLFVLAGSACHFYTVYRYVLPHQ